MLLEEDTEELKARKELLCKIELHYDFLVLKQNYTMILGLQTVFHCDLWVLKQNFTVVFGF